MTDEERTRWPKLVADHEASELRQREFASAGDLVQAVDAAAAGDALLELALPSGARLRFPAGTDLKYLRALAPAL